MHELNGIGNAPVSRQEKRAVAQRERQIATENPLAVGTLVVFGKGNKQYGATVIGPRRQDGMYPIRPSPPLDQVMPVLFMPPRSLKAVGSNLGGRVRRSRGTRTAAGPVVRSRPGEYEYEAQFAYEGKWGPSGHPTNILAQGLWVPVDRVRSEITSGAPTAAGLKMIYDNEPRLVRGDLSRRWLRVVQIRPATPQAPPPSLAPTPGILGLGYHPPHLKPSATMHPAGSPSYQATPRQDYNLPLYRRMQIGARGSPASPNYVVADIGPRGIPPGLVPPEMLVKSYAPQAATPAPAASGRFEIAGMGNARNIPAVIVAPSPAQSLETFREGIGLGRKWDPWGEE